MPARLLICAAIATLCMAVLIRTSAFDVLAANSDSPVPEIRSGFSGDPNQPRRHFRVRDNAKLDRDEARMMYAKMLPLMANGYALADGNVASTYRDWQRFNTAPYTSATHGRRYVNNYGNALARDYGRFKDAAPMPQGAILAKDSFTVTKTGKPVPGPLFIMEKMAPGFNYVSGDWRYSMIMPDGSLFGTTNGVGSRRVEFCISCHLARETTDHLFFVPEAYRQETK